MYPQRSTARTIPTAEMMPVASLISHRFSPNSTPPATSAMTARRSGAITATCGDEDGCPLNNHHADIGPEAAQAAGGCLAVREREPPWQRLDGLRGQGEIDDSGGGGAQQGEEQHAAVKSAKEVEQKWEWVEIRTGRLAHQQFDGPHVVAEETPHEQAG